ncbi:low density lipoprotein receptor adapter protein 1 [Saccopteryx bilineata]|uniref:low density lipoprotein receptor adapter protein 1 n=1 Tax=Saccopteryx bilineata TaxID=59482 RepID=UPI00338F99F3
MDALKSAGRALIRSPSLAKQSWGGGGRHRKLPENWTDTRETLLEGMLFSLKYLGMTLVEQPKGEEMSAAAVKRIVATAKASGKKLQKVTLKVSPRGIILTDSITNQLIENVSIYRISYCTADKMHGKVFAYIAQSQHNENLECHAFLCTKRKMAQAVTLTVAQAFKVAFEFWQVSKEEKEKREKASQEGGDIMGGGRCDSTPSSLKNLVATGNLLDLEEMAKAPLSTVSANTTNVDEAPRPQALNNSSVVWELDDDLDEAFSRLAQSRTNPQVLDTGLTAQDIHYAQCLSPTDWDKPDGGGAEQEDLFSF